MKNKKKNKPRRQEDEDYGQKYGVKGAKAARLKAKMNKRKKQKAGYYED